jgi:hypothetical protein
MQGTEWNSTYEVVPCVVNRQHGGVFHFAITVRNVNRTNDRRLQLKVKSSLVIEENT